MTKALTIPADNGSQPCTRLHPCPTAVQLWDGVASAHSVMAHRLYGTKKHRWAYDAYLQALERYETHLVEHGASVTGEQPALLEVEG